MPAGRWRGNRSGGRLLCGGRGAVAEWDQGDLVAEPEQGSARIRGQLVTAYHHLKPLATTQQYRSLAIGSQP